MLNSMDDLITASAVIRWSLIGSAVITLVLTITLMLVSSRLEGLRRQQALPRRLTPEQKLKLLNALPRKPHKVRVYCMLGDAESCTYAADFIEVLKQANWEVDGPNQVVFSEPIPALWISIADKANVPPSADALGHALEHTEIQFIGRIDERLGLGILGLTVGHKSN